MIISNIERVLFHGTSHDVECFSDVSVGVGSDPNSALGVHTTDFPESAANYAELSKALDVDSKDPIVLVIRYLSAGQAYIDNYDEFYGTYDDETNNKAHFEQLRRDHIEGGVDLIDYEGGEAPITTLLKPDKMTIIDKLTVKQARLLSEYLSENAIDYDQPGDIIKAVAYIKCVA